MSLMQICTTEESIISYQLDDFDELINMEAAMARRAMRVVNDRAAPHKAVPNKKVS